MIDGISDEDLLTVIEALDLMASISVGFPPLEANRFYLSSQALFERFSNEAICRGYTDYATIDPISDEIYPGEEIGDSSPLDQLKAWHRNECFLRGLISLVSQFAADRDFPNPSDFDSSERRQSAFNYAVKIERIIATEGIEPFLNTDCLFNRESSS